MIQRAEQSAMLEFVQVSVEETRFVLDKKNPSFFTRINMVYQ